MSYTIKIDTSVVADALEYALIGTAQVGLEEIVKITPRDPKRMPQNIDRKDGKKPNRSTHFKPVNIGGHWYQWVSGMLKRSVAMEKTSQFQVRIGIQRWPTELYGRAQEFGTPRIPPRSFLRKWIIDNNDKLVKRFKSLFKFRLSWKT